mmetsp:Transcript_43175/g.105626  ORF Transcript_43175/g.105626 Transcript_43175/m.105626 type:complete len:256 (+) Transcript_43175:109-876(+)
MGVGGEAVEAMMEVDMPAHAGGGRRDEERPQSADTVDMEVDAPAAVRALGGVPEDCFVHVLKGLQAAELVRAAMVNRDFRRLSGADQFWQKLCVADYGADAGLLLECYKPVVPAGEEFWKRVYRELREYRIELEFTAGPRSGDHQEVARDKECSLGRSRQNDVCILHDEMVSRKHAKIAVEGRHYCLTDVGGINRTFINQRVIPQHVPTRLCINDQVDMGSSCFMVRLLPPAAHNGGAGGVPGPAGAGEKETKTR